MKRHINRNELINFTKRLPRTNAKTFLLENMDGRTNVWEPINNGYSLLDSFVTIDDKEPAEGFPCP